MNRLAEEETEVTDSKEIEKHIKQQNKNELTIDSNKPAQIGIMTWGEEGIEKDIEI